MTFWPLTNSDFPTNQTFHQFHDLDTDFDLHRITSGFHGAFAKVVAYQQGTLTLPDTWFRPPPILGLANAQIVETKFLELAMSFYSTFHLEYPLVLYRFCLQENEASLQCVEWMDKHTYVSLIHMAILTTNYWIYLLRPSVFWHLLQCFHVLYGQMPAINKPPTKCVKL